jgi:uncharacterized protein YndB with AHSA1/START domain
MTIATEAPRLRDDELLITREFNAPLPLVWRMWEDENHIRRWWGPEGFTILEFSSDFRPGGTWRCRMISDIYGEGRAGGTFREIEKEKRIVFSFAWDADLGDPTPTTVTVTFEERDGRTVQHFHQTPFSSVESRDSHVGGWNSLFNKEAAYAEALAAA